VQSVSFWGLFAGEQSCIGCMRVQRNCRQLAVSACIQLHQPANVQCTYLFAYYLSPCPNLLVVGFLSRPIGAVLFGHLGDTRGRGLCLLLSVLLMGIPTVLIGCLPGYATIGIAAPILLAFLRLVQGLAMGGEFGAVRPACLGVARSMRCTVRLHFIAAYALVLLGDRLYKHFVTSFPL
jgi:Sugar (and other) transporter